MRRHSSKKKEDSFELKRTQSPVSGAYCYSIFKNGKLVFMNDGDRISVFRPGDVGTISVTGLKYDYRLYRVGVWIFTGSIELTHELLAELPDDCTICPSFGDYN